LAQHARNGFLDYQTHTLNLYLRPSSVRYPWVLNFRVYTIPSYYLRSHYDRDTREFHAARFQNWQYRFAPRFRFWKSLWIELRAEFETLYYNSKFTEYDCETSSWGIGGEYGGLQSFTFEGYYLRNHCDNIGYRQIGTMQAGLLDVPGVDTEYGDLLRFPSLPPLKSAMHMKNERRAATNREWKMSRTFKSTRSSSP
jgi:hypothetical protein